MKRLAMTALPFLALMLISVTIPPSASAQIQVFSTGQYGTPETISLAPSGFGAFGGNYFIPDARTNNIWVLPASGGPPTPLLSTPIELPPGSSVIGGTFLPSGWGSNSGKFFLACLRYTPLVFDAAGNAVFFDSSAPQGLFANPLIAPTQFGDYGGHLFVTDEMGYVWRADPAGGGLTVFAEFPNFQSGPYGALFWFGIEFAPAVWGAFGSHMLVSDAFPSVDNGPGTRASYVAAVSTGGTASLFATVALKDGENGAPGQNGLRQMLMTPDNYFLDSLGIPGQVLLLSVSGSGFGGGVLGETLALDSSGTIVGHLKVGSVLAKYDPRGMTFTSDGDLLISDTSDPILKASASDFAPGREDCRPSVTSSVSIPSLWPPNHNLVDVGLAAIATDTCPGAPTLTATVFSNEGDLSAAGGDGNFSPDAKNIGVGTLRLRAERGGDGQGRIYLVVVKITDAWGFVAGSCSTVVVPRDESEAAKDTVDVQAATAKTFCETHAFAPPPGYVVVGNGPVVGPRQ